MNRTIAKGSVETARTVFVLNMDANGLGVTRSLGWKGIKVVGVDYRKGIPGLRSRLARPLLTPDPVKEPEATVDLLMQEGANLSEKGVVMACSDAFVLLLSRYRRRLSEHFDFLVPPEDVVECVIDKRRQYALAERVGVPIPFTVFPRDLSELEASKDMLRYPSLIKPFQSHLWNRRFGNKGFIVKDFQDLEYRYSKVLESGLEAMVQCIVGTPGDDLFQVSAYLGKKDYTSPSFVWYKARQAPPSFGIASLGVSTHNREVEDLGLRFLRSIGYKGIGSVEFKFDPEDKIYRLIELNNRTWMQNVMCTVAGLNLPLIQYMDLTDQDCPLRGDYADGVRWWDAIADIDSFIRLMRRGELSLGDWIRSWLGSDCYAYFSLDDPMPAMVRARYGINVAKALVYALRRAADEDFVQLGG